MATETPPKPDPVTMLNDLFASGGGISIEAGRNYLGEIPLIRQLWRER
jgi:hypothetical protein